MFTIRCLAVYVVDKRTIISIHGRLFLVEKRDIHYLLLASQKVVEEVQKQRLGDLLSEDSLETYVRERIDELRHTIQVLLFRVTTRKAHSPHKTACISTIKADAQSLSLRVQS